MNNYKFKSCVQVEDQQAIIELLVTIKDELYLPDQTVAQKVTKLCFEKGGVITGYHENQLCAMLGYFLGELDCDYVNKEVGFLYVAGILQQYRLTRMFHRGLIFALKHLRAHGVKEIRLLAEAANPYTNRLYGRFAQPVAQGKSPRGIPVITYGGSIEDALNHLEHRQRPSPMPKMLLSLRTA